MNKPSLSWSGFVRADAMYDTRQVVEAREGYLLLYPKNHSLDSEGKDINGQGSFNQYAMTARLAAKISGPVVMGAKTTALIEGDFTGASNAENNSLRLRHAYAKLSWNKVSLLAGQYWHPLDVPEMIPNVLSLNTGAPFHSYSRQPQFRMDMKMLQRLNLVLAISSQRDYVNPGPAGSSSTYLRNSRMPNLHAQIQYNSGHFFAGGGFDYKRLVPRLVTDSNFVSDEKVDCFAGTAFMKVILNPIEFKFQAVYGQNLNDHLMLGGYGVSSTDPLTNRNIYTSLNYFSTWMSISTTGNKVQYSLFGGYTKGFGSEEEITGSIYARDPDIAYVFRIAPMVSWTTGNLSVNGEMELTTAAYGKPDGYYSVSDINTVNNLRLTASLSYIF